MGGTIIGCLTLVVIVVVGAIAGGLFAYAFDIEFLKALAASVGVQLILCTAAGVHALLRSPM